MGPEDEFLGNFHGAGRAEKWVAGCIEIKERSGDDESGFEWLVFETRNRERLLNRRHALKINRR